MKKEKELLKIQALDPKQQKITFRNGKLSKLIYFNMYRYWYVVNQLGALPYCFIQCLTCLIWLEISR